MTPKQRLQEAAHRLAGSAEKLEEVICPTPRVIGGGFGDPKDEIPSDSLPGVVKAGIEEVRAIASEIEEIVK